jgi:hypothetical protein
VGMWIGAAAMEISMEILKKTPKNKIDFWSYSTIPEHIS